MEPWKNRPFEYRRLFNPAFCAVLLLRALNGYRKVTGKGMPFSLTFLILPLCLYEDSRKVLLQRNGSKILTILSDHPEMLVGFSRRAKALVPYTLEGFGYARSVKSLNIYRDGTLSVKDQGIKASITGSDEVRECQIVAASLGRAFAKAGNKVTIFTSMRIQP